MSKTIFIELVDGAVRLPTTVCTFDGFRAWAMSEQFPERGRFSFMNREVFIDMTPEDLETHNPVKTEVTRVVSNLVVEDDSGKYYSDRTLVTNKEADLSTEPDGTFVTWE